MSSAAESQEALARNELASVWMKRGIALLTENNAASLNESINCFNQAIALRRTLPFHANSWFCYGLVAGWMNRADAQTRLGSKENLDHALRSYDEALGCLQKLALDENPLFRRRMAIAWLNRGITLQEIGTQECLAQAVNSFDASIATLQNDKAEAISDRDQILASAWLNRGNVSLRLTVTDSLSARMASKLALILVGKTENHEPQAAEIGFKARHVLCRALAHLLARPEPESQLRDQWIVEATDAVDDGMKLAREWESRGADRFRGLATDLFRFGARVYQLYQPHFLSEFLSESLEADESPDAMVENPEMRAVAREALWHALREIQRTGFKDLNSDRFRTLVENFRELRITESRIHQRASQAVSAPAPTGVQTAARE